MSQIHAHVSANPPDARRSHSPVPPLRLHLEIDPSYFTAANNAGPGTSGGRFLPATSAQRAPRMSKHSAAIKIQSAYRGMRGRKAARLERKAATMASHLITGYISQVLSSADFVNEVVMSITDPTECSVLVAAETVLQDALAEAVSAVCREAFHACVADVVRRPGVLSSSGMHMHAFPGAGVRQSVDLMAASRYTYLPGLGLGLGGVGAPGHGASMATGTGTGAYAMTAAPRFAGIRPSRAELVHEYGALGGLGLVLGHEIADGVINEYVRRAVTSVVSHTVHDLLLEHFDGAKADDAFDAILVECMASIVRDEYPGMVRDVHADVICDALIDDVASACVSEAHAEVSELSERRSVEHMLIEMLMGVVVAPHLSRVLGPNDDQGIADGAGAGTARGTGTLAEAGTGMSDGMDAVVVEAVCGRAVDAMVASFLASAHLAPLLEWTEARRLANLCPTSTLTSNVPSTSIGTSTSVSPGCDCICACRARSALREYCAVMKEIGDEVLDGILEEMMVGASAGGPPR